VQASIIKGKHQYLMIIEAQSSNGRYFRSLTATSLGRSWTSQAASVFNPFAGKAGSGATWTNDIALGEIIWSHPGPTFIIDACNLQLLCQGHGPKWTATIASSHSARVYSRWPTRSA
jgi:hypothetical protein